MIKLKKKSKLYKRSKEKKIKNQENITKSKDKKINKLRGSFGWLGSKSDDEREKKKWIFMPNRRSF